MKGIGDFGKLSIRFGYLARTSAVLRFGFAIEGTTRMNDLRAFFVDPANSLVEQIAPEVPIFQQKIGAGALNSVTVWKTGCDGDMSLDDDGADGVVMVLIDDEALKKHALHSWTFPAPVRGGTGTFYGPAVVVLEGNIGVDAEDTYGSVENLRRTIGFQ